MISGLSKSIYAAIRTADNAQKDAQKFTTQMATGKKVSSVKDNGAAYAIAASHQSKISEMKATQDTAAILLVENNNAYLQMEFAYDIADRMAGVLLKAQTYTAGSSSRNALAAEYAQLVAEFDSNVYSNASLAPWVPGVNTIATPPGEGLFNGNSYFSIKGTSLGANHAWLDNDYNSNGQLPRNININTASSANLKAAMDNVLYMRDMGAASHLKSIAAEGNQIANVEKTAIRFEDKYNAAISSLTDADISKVSEQKSKAETRQTLALQTINSAISAYGNFAGGLLNNIMGTQRNLRA